jgi:hypothetical protein
MGENAVAFGKAGNAKLNKNAPAVNACESFVKRRATLLTGAQD